MRAPRRGARELPRDRARRARFVAIDLDAAARAAARVTPTRAHTSRATGRRLPAPARRDQLRLGLVPDAAQAARPVGLPHDRGARFAEHGPWANAELRRARRRRGGAACSARSREHPLMRLYAEALRDLGRFLGERSALRPRGRGRRLGRAAGDAAGARHALLRRPRLLQARADRAERPGAGRASPSSTTSTGSRSSPTTSCRTCCAWTACCATTPSWRRASTPSELLPPGRAEREIRACAVHACELLAERTGIAAARCSTCGSGTAGRRRSTRRVPRHRTRTVYY